MLRRSVVILIFVLTVMGCKEQDVPKPPPIELTREHICSVCGMIIVDFPGPKAQIHYRGGRVDTFCSVAEMISFYLQPDRPRGIVAIYVNDMSGAEWKHPLGRWIDAEDAYYVYGARISGAMGQEMVPFSDYASAEGFIRKHGGRVVRFNEIKMDMLRPEL